MGRPSKLPEEKRSKWSVLNPTWAERAAIAAAAQEAGLGINDYILACTRQTRVIRRADRAQMVRHLAGIESRLDEIARQAMSTPFVTCDVASLLLALRRIETSLRAGALASEDDGDEAEDPAC